MSSTDPEANPETPSAATAPPHVVIVGAGFAGIACAKELAAHDVAVTLVDKNTYHQFQPLLYQVATAQLAATDVMRPLRGLFRKHPTVAVKNAEVATLDPTSRSVTTTTGEHFQGDQLVLAIGSTPNFFGISGAQENSYPLYSGNDAVRLRNRILQLFEDADLNPERIEMGALNFVIVGGGPTGVETAGALADLLFGIMGERYHDLDVDRSRIILVDHSEVLLRPFSQKAHNYASKILEDKGVELMLGTSVEEIHPDRVVLAGRTEIRTHCVVWAGGLKPLDLSGLDSLPVDRRGRITVRPDLGVDGFPGVYAIGDAADAADDDDNPYPQLASVAAQAGRAAAASILAENSGEPRPPFEYHDKGIMAMIGRRAAIAEIGGRRHELHGLIAFSAWLGVHAWLMSSTRGRIDAFISWAWDWFTHSRSPAIVDGATSPQIDWTHGGETPQDPVDEQMINDEMGNDEMGNDEMGNDEMGTK